MDSQPRLVCCLQMFIDPFQRKLDAHETSWFETLSPLMEVQGCSNACGMATRISINAEAGMEWYGIMRLESHEAKIYALERLENVVVLYHWSSRRNPSERPLKREKKKHKHIFNFVFETS